MSVLRRAPCVLLTALCFVSISCSLKRPEPKEPIVTYTSPYSVLNVCFNADDTGTVDTLQFPGPTGPTASEVKGFPLFGVRFTDSGDISMGTLRVEYAYRYSTRRLTRGKLTGEPSRRVLTDELYTKAEGDNGVYGWDCRGRKSESTYLPKVKIYLENDSQKAYAKLRSQGINYDPGDRVSINSFLGEGLAEETTEVLTIRHDKRGYLPKVWKSCDIPAETCLVFEAGWEQDINNPNKYRLALRQIAETSEIFPEESTETADTDGDPATQENDATPSRSDLLDRMTR